MADEPQLSEGAAEAEALTADSFTELLKQNLKVKSEEQATEVEAAVETFAREALQGIVIGDDAEETIKALIEEIDERLTTQINKILHHPDFQQLESAWRGLHYLVSNTETDSQLKIKVMNISKKELTKTVKKFSGVSWDQGPLFKKIYEEEYGTPGGQPYGCLVGDYFFDHSAEDVRTLSGMAQIGAAAHVPFIAGAAPSVMQMESWQEIGDKKDLTSIFGVDEYAAWRALRESEDSRYLGLALPRFLARLPYGPKTEPVEEFLFQEETGNGDSACYTWANAAYAMAVNINQAFKYYGWCSQIRGMKSGGLVEGLPVHTFPSDDGSMDMKCPTEIAITERREHELAKNGFMPLQHVKGTEQAVFMGAQSLQKPAEYDDPDATANAKLSANLPYMFACCRFAHYLKVMVRENIGSLTTRDRMQRYLQDWILNYVAGDPENASQAQLAKKPLAAAAVEVNEVEGSPGYYSSTFRLKPHYQLEGLTVSLRLVSKLPSS